MTGALDGVRILDLTRILAGPACTQLLGDYGADVIKVERPGNGDDTRAWGPPFLEGEDGNLLPESAYYLSVNRNKRSLAADIATGEGAALVRRLAKHCDALVENFKPGGLRKYRLDWDSLREINPRLVYCSITGFGQTGPNASKPGYDLAAQGYGGIMSVTGEPGGEPMKVGVAVSDVVCGLYAATAILAALRHRDRAGEGQHIDIALADTQVAWLVNVGQNYLISGKEPARHGNQHPNIVPYQVFEAADGHVIVAAGNDAQYQRLCAIVGVPELGTDPRFAGNSVRVRNRAELLPLLAGAIRAFTKEDLVVRMEQEGIPGGPIHTVPEALATDQVAAREMRVRVPCPQAKGGSIELIGNPVKFGATPVSYRRAPPACGEHTGEVHAELDEREVQED